MMRHAASVVAAVVLSIAAASAQSPSQKAVPRAADGKPDLSGIWIATGYG